MNPPVAALGHGGQSVTLRNVRLAVLVSGSGTLLESMLAAGLPVELIIADRPCRGLSLGDDAGVATHLLERSEWGERFGRDDYAQELSTRLVMNGIDLVAMAGFGTVLGAPIFAAMPERILNTHPALLPAFPGWHAVRDAMAFGVKVTGCTIHVATPEVDHGPILAQEAVTICHDDDEASLHERIKAIERRLYVDVLSEIAGSGQLLGNPI